MNFICIVYTFFSSVEESDDLRDDLDFSYKNNFNYL